MTAYSYKRRFVEPIRRGLVSAYPDQNGIRPKRQTIRADRKRHARPGEEIQHYCGMRTKGCFLIGRSTCTELKPIRILVEVCRIIIDFRKRYPTVLETIGELNDFAQADGFAHWNAMQEFWRENHPSVTDFRGVIIYWEPKT